MRGISVVIPAYNSSKTLPIMAGRILSTLRDMGNDFELILVNDGSEDNTWDVIVDLVSENNWIFGINLSRNFGQHNALLCGIRSARFEKCVTLDDDLQHPPEEIPKLIRRLDEGFEVVYGIPRSLRHGVIRNFSSIIIRWVGQVFFRIKRSGILSSFRAFETDLRSGFKNFTGLFVSIDVLLSWNASRYGHVKVRHDRRQSEKSNYTIWKLFTLSLIMLSGLGPVPFRGVIRNRIGSPAYTIRETIHNLKHDSNTFED
jgi:undecaprenyl-phosphate 4-deoxy-4-formamido-L-arabinose transferase